MILSEIFYSVLKNRCPRCHRGKVFENDNPYNLKNGLSMKNACLECELTYESEPGFFFGALYVSYGISSGIFSVLYLLDAFWIQMETWLLLTLIITAIVVFYPFSYRWGRLFWLNFFVRYDKKYKPEKKSNAN